MNYIIIWTNIQGEDCTKLTSALVFHAVCCKCLALQARHSMVQKVMFQVHSMNQMQNCPLETCYMPYWFHHTLYVQWLPMNGSICIVWVASGVFLPP
jgi:hypothetical protein